MVHEFPVLGHALPESEQRQRHNRSARLRQALSCHSLTARPPVAQQLSGKD
jgi:hypothetical protein